MRFPVLKIQYSFYYSLIAASLAYAQPKTYYVSSSAGNNANNGTSPATFQKTDDSSIQEIIVKRIPVLGLHQIVCEFSAAKLVWPIINPDKSVEPIREASSLRLGFSRQLVSKLQMHSSLAVEIRRVFTKTLHILLFAERLKSIHRRRIQSELFVPERRSL
jgi:hypothetical protein